MQLDRIEKSEKHRMEQNIEYNGITPIEKKYMKNKRIEYIRVQLNGIEI